MDLDIQTSNLNIHFWAKVTVLPEDWYTWYLGGAYYISELLFSKFQLQNPFLSKFGPKKDSLFIFIWNFAAVFGHTASFVFVF